MEYKIKGEGREKKLAAKRAMMPIHGRSLKSVILPLLGKKAKKKPRSKERGFSGRGELDQ